MSTTGPRARPPAANPAISRVFDALETHGSTYDSGQDWSCPAHDDDRASLGVTEGDTQPVVLKCQAGCSFGDVLDALDLAPSDLRVPMTETKRWTYTDAGGQPLYDVVRKEDGYGGKQFHQIGYRNGKPVRGSGALDGLPRVLLALPKVSQAVRSRGRVVITEGETSADAVNGRPWKKGRPHPFATTAPQGASAEWLDTFTEALRGASHITVIADRDKAGFERAARVYDALTASLGPDGTKVALKLSATEGKGDDVVDHFAAGKRWADLVPVERHDLVWSEPDSGVSSDPFGKLGQVLTRSALAALPRPEPLLEDWLELRTTVVVVGETGTNKSFLVLGWACSVATGRPWLGHAVAVDPTPVLLVVGEGGSGLHSRISAWETANGVEVPDDKLVTLLGAASLTDPEVWSQAERLALENGVRLVVLDTLSSLAPDADETKDAAVVVRRMTDLARAIDGTVVVVHHTGWDNKGRTRGGSQLESNPDSVVVLERKGDETDTNPPVSVRRKKAKESEAGLTVHVERSSVAGSCVLVSTFAPAPKTSGTRDSDLDRRERALRAVDDADPFTYTVSGLGKEIGGNFAARARVIEELLASGDLETRHLQAREGRRSVVRERIGRPEGGEQPAPATERGGGG